MSSIRPNANGKLFFDFRHQGVRCRELTALDDTSTNRKKMQGLLDRMEAEMTLGTFQYAAYFPQGSKAEVFSKGAIAPLVPVAATPTFAEFVATWRIEKEVEWRYSYRKTIHNILHNHLLPQFGEQLVGGIERGDVLQYRAALVKRAETGGRSIKNDTVNRIITILRQILDEASQRHSFTNPVARMNRLKQIREEITPFTLDEVRKVILSVRPDYQDYLILRFFTGVRTSEANGLKWKHVDWDRGQLLIRETYQSGRTETTKTDGSRRDIQLPQLVRAMLEQRRPKKLDPEAYIFGTRRGLPIDNKNFNNRVWQPLLRLCGLKHRRPYQMRHTCATLWLASGESQLWIANQLGHTTVEMLHRTYGRYIPNAVRHDGRAFDQLASAAFNGGLTLVPSAPSTPAPRLRSPRAKPVAPAKPAAAGPMVPTAASAPEPAPAPAFTIHLIR